MKWLLAVTLLTLVVWAFGLVVFVARLPDSPAAFPLATDGIVVLTGGRDRLRAGLLAWQQNPAAWLFISGVSPQTPTASAVSPLLLQATGVNENQLRGRLMIGRLAGDTVGNALETALWVRLLGIHSLLVVTSTYHMPRSLVEFSAVMPADVRLIPYPVQSSGVAHAGWWYHGGTLTLFALEYSKYLFARVRHGLFPLADTGDI